MNLLGESQNMPPPLPYGTQTSHTHTHLVKCLHNRIVAHAHSGLTLFSSLMLQAMQWSPLQYEAVRVGEHAHKPNDVVMTERAQLVQLVSHVRVATCDLLVTQAHNAHF